MPTPRFLTLDDVAEILNVSWSQAYALVRRKELIAIQIGGRGQWRVEVDELERFIQQKYVEARGSTLADFRESWFYSDSQNDLPLLTRVTHPVAVNPDAVLAAHARHKGWPQIALM